MVAPGPKGGVPNDKKKKSKERRRWTPAEVSNLKKGVERYGESVDACLCVDTFRDYFDMLLT